MIETRRFLDEFKDILKKAEKLDNKDAVFISIPLKEAKTVIDALEKQVPQEPRLEGDGYADGSIVHDTWICPSCGKDYEIDYDEYDYCPNCGQRIDWEDEK